MKLLVGGVSLDVEVTGDTARVRDGEREVTFTAAAAGPGRVRGEGGGLALDVWVSGARAGARGQVFDVTRTGARTTVAAGLVTPPIPATVARIFVAVGDVVEAGAPLVALTAMKTEFVLHAAAAGTVTEVRVAVGANVRPGDQLVVLAPS